MQRQLLLPANAASQCWKRSSKGDSSTTGGAIYLLDCAPLLSIPTAFARRTGLRKKPLIQLFFKTHPHAESKSMRGFFRGCRHLAATSGVSVGAESERILLECDTAHAARAQEFSSGGPTTGSRIPTSSMPWTRSTAELWALARNKVRILCILIFFERPIYPLWALRATCKQNSIIPRRKIFDFWLLMFYKM